MKSRLITTSVEILRIFSLGQICWKIKKISLKKKKIVNETVYKKPIEQTSNQQVRQQKHATFLVVIKCHLRTLLTNVVIID
jgi:hypothetical protein